MTEELERALRGGLNEYHATVSFEEQSLLRLQNFNQSLGDLPADDAERARIAHARAQQHEVCTTRLHSAHLRTAEARGRILGIVEGALARLGADE